MTKIGMSRRMTWAMLAVAATLAPAQTATDRLESKTVGIAITKPHGWQVIVQQHETIQGNARWKDEDLLQAMQKGGPVPVFVFTRYPEPHPEGLNPSVQIILRPLGQMAGRTPNAIMEVSIEPLKKAFPDFHFTSEIKAATIGGQAGSSMKATYTLTKEGKKYPTQAGFWIVPRGKLMFLIGTAGPQTGPDVAEAEFDKLVKSITIQP
jgi:hypothetical protein